MPSTVLHESAASVVGQDAVREGGTADAIESVVPQVVVEPVTPEAVAAIMGWASRERLCVCVRGAGTKLGWGPAPRSIDVLISTARLNSRRCPSSWRSHRHDSGGRHSGKRQSHARPASPVDSARSAWRRSRDHRRSGCDQRQRSAPASLRRPARSDHRRGIRPGRRTPRKGRRHRREERRRVRPATADDWFIRQPRSHRGGDVQAVSADLGVAHARRRAPFSRRSSERSPAGSSRAS